MTKIKNSQRKYILAAVILLVCLITGFAYKAATWSPEDYTSQKASEDRIRSAAFRFPENEPDNPKDEFANVTKLILGESKADSVSYTVELTDIKLLEKFTNLQMLHIGHIIYPRTDIPKWMTVLAKLGIYDIDKRFALDLSPLEKLHNLQYLTINRTTIKDIKPLSGLVNLQHLDLNSAAVSDLKPIKNLKNLEYLDISYTQVNNLEPIKGLTNLQTLYTYRTQISDLRPLKELKNLKRLYLGVPNITDQQVEDLQKALPNLRIER